MLRQQEVLARSTAEAEARLTKLKEEMTLRDEREAEARAKIRESEAAAWELELQVRTERERAHHEAQEALSQQWDGEKTAEREAAKLEQEAKHAAAVDAAQSREAELKKSLEELQSLYTAKRQEYEALVEVEYAQLLHCCVALKQQMELLGKSFVCFCQSPSFG